MPHVSEHFSSLRQEITRLRNINTRYSEKRNHSPMEKSALELRTIRLLQIKEDLSKRLNHLRDPAVWWEKSRKLKRGA